MKTSTIKRAISSAVRWPLAIRTGSLAIVVAFCSVVPAAEKPNILLIMADDVGQQAIGCYGGTSYKTPRLDQLAAGGLRFEQCHSMPVCHPTRICLLTGRYPFRLNNPGWGTFPKAEEKNTIAHSLKDAGYATAIAGKWQLVLQKNDPDHPQRLGFDESCVFGWHEGPRYYSPMIYQNGKLRAGLEDRFGPDVYVEFLTDFMEGCVKKDQPFFAYYSMALCHDVTDDLKEPVPHGAHDRYDNYQEMIEKMDACVGRLIDALDRLKLRKNTLVLFTGDNGTPVSYIAKAEGKKLIRIPIEMQVGDKKVRGGKGQLTDAGTRVPLIASWPGVIEEGKTSAALVDFSDYFATLADLAGAETPDGIKIDGVSFLPALQGEISEGRLWAFAEHGKKCWVRNQGWKLYDDGRLFNMTADELEKNPILKQDDDRDSAANRKKLTVALKGLGKAIEEQ